MERQSEILAQWEPKNGFNRLYRLENFGMHFGRTEIFFIEVQMLKNAAQMIIGGIESYRIFSGFMQKIRLQELMKKYKKALLSNWYFFVLEHSEYVKNLMRNPMGMYDFGKLKHYIIITHNAILELAVDADSVIQVKCDNFDTHFNELVLK